MTKVTSIPFSKGPLVENFSYQLRHDTTPGNQRSEEPLGGWHFARRLDLIVWLLAAKPDEIKR
jgi:hypothetical protein